MNAEDKLKKAKHLAKHATFHRLFAKRRKRTWFAWHILDHLLGGAGIVNIEAEAKTFIDGVVTLAHSRRNGGFSVGQTLDAQLRTLNRRRRVQIVYGLVAKNPNLVKPENLALLDFTLNRVSRCVLRMDYHINGWGYADYPSNCGKTEPQLNAASRPHWDKVPHPLSGFTEFVLKAGVNAEVAIASLFTRTPGSRALSTSAAYTTYCSNTNLVDCSLALCMTLLDSLLEAHNPAKFIKYLADKKRPAILDVTKLLPRYIEIRVPNTLRSKPVGTHGGPARDFIFDDTAEALFTKSEQPVSELQVGDHVYIRNHPLYRTFRPNGAWRGEHAFVYDFDQDSVTTKRGFRFGGHGIPQGGQTIQQMFKDHLRLLNTFYRRTCAIVRHHLSRKSTTTPTTEKLKVDENLGRQTAPPPTEKAYDVYEYEVRFLYRLLVPDQEWTHLGFPPRGQVDKFVIIQYKNEPVFVIDAKKTRKEVRTAGKSTNPVFIIGTNAPAGSQPPIDLIHWQISYRNKPENGYGARELHVDGSPQPRPKLLTIQDLMKHPFMKKDLNTQSVSVTRPRVDTSPEFLTFMKREGALANP